MAATNPISCFSVLDSCFWFHCWKDRCFFDSIKNLHIPKMQFEMMFVFFQKINFGSPAPPFFFPTPIGPSGREEGRMWPPVSLCCFRSTQQVTDKFTYCWYMDPYKNPINNGKFTLSTGRVHYWYCRWFRNPVNSPVEVGSLSHHLQGFVHPSWCRIASINSSLSNKKRHDLSNMQWWKKSRKNMYMKPYDQLEKLTISTGARQISSMNSIYRWGPIGHSIVPALAF